MVCSEQAVNEGRKCGALRKDQQPAEGEKKNDDGSQPPFLALAQETPKFLDNGQFVHSEKQISSMRTVGDCEQIPSASKARSNSKTASRNLRGADLTFSSMEANNCVPGARF